jgi:hypothetical protein
LRSAGALGWPCPRATACRAASRVGPSKFSLHQPLETKLKRSALPHVVVGALGAQSRMVLCLQAKTRSVFGGRRGGRWAWWAPRSAHGMFHVTLRIRRGGSSGNGAVRVVALPVWSARGLGAGRVRDAGCDVAPRLGSVRPHHGVVLWSLSHLPA